LHEQVRGEPRDVLRINRGLIAGDGQLTVGAVQVLDDVSRRVVQRACSAMALDGSLKVGDGAFGHGWSSG
jgi:hypothetical protein